MDNAQKLFDTFTKSTNPTIIIEAAHEINKHFKWIWGQEPTDEIGEEFLYIISAKQESFEWLLLMMIHQINGVGYHEYFTVLENREDLLSDEQCKWGKIVLKAIQPQMTNPFIGYCSDLLEIFDRVIERSLQKEKDKINDNLLESTSQESTISANSGDRLPDYFLIICDKQPKIKNEFVKSIIESLDYFLGSNTIIETSQYNNAQTLDSALPYAIAFATSRFEEQSLELDLDETKYSGFRSISSGIPIYGYSFGMFSKIKGKKAKDEEKKSYWQKIFGKKKKSHVTSSNTQSVKNNNKLKDFEFKIIPINEYYGFFKQLAKEIGTTDPDVVYTKIRVYCEGCGVQYKQEALEMLFALGTGGMFGGASTVVIGGTNEGNDFRSGKCPKCGHTRMKILVHD